ncbi:MAG: hypothetical protein VXX85_05720 [Candidatus Margulisiibacteriota bacterium]|nr:hypothetical protein [Candidatus Margulisiibacteriota bacterium]
MSKNKKWDSNNNAVKATQLAFELEQKVMVYIQQMAIKNFLSTSNQIRKLLGLSYAPPKRPRLTVSLSSDDYIQLGKKYNIEPSDKIGIKRRIMAELIDIIDE